jgi:N-acetylglucosamine-6-phosphate deacetylase
LIHSVVTLDKCVRNFARFTGCALGPALLCATLRPAQCLGLADTKGTLRAGADADLAVFAHDGTVLQTWVRGALAWARE